MTDKELISLAKSARENSYSPYSKFSVGVALFTKSEKVYLGTNIENASFGATVCAERVAIFKAVSEGEKEFDSIAIVGSFDEFCYPCGICRQVMSEFFSSKTKIILEKNNEIEIFHLSDFLPNSFKM